jgi:hypothetical protein
LAVRDPGSSTGGRLSIAAWIHAGDYAAAQAGAERELKRFPGDKALLTLLHQAKGRSAPASSRSAPKAEAGSPGPASDARGDDRPHVLAVKAPPGGAAPPPVAGAYLPPGSRSSPSLFRGFDERINEAAYALDRESPREKERMAGLRKKLDSTETGRALVLDLGGWEKIDGEVDIRFAWIASGYYAYARPLAKPDAAGRRRAVVINTSMLEEQDAVVVPILAHELSHIRDYGDGVLDDGLHIPSEYSAHRTQIQVFEELKALLTPAQAEELKRSPAGQYQLFIAMLWEDHLLQRFGEPAEMARAAGGGRGYLAMAKRVFADLRDGTVGPGGAQLDYHLNGKKDGLYRVAIGKKDIIESEVRHASVLARRERLLGDAESRDDAFRRRRGFQLEDKK